MNTHATNEHRRLLLKFLAGSPLLSLGLPGFLSGQATNDFLQSGIITKPSQAINIFDFQKTAKAKLPPAHYGYMETGVLDDRTLLENRKGFERIQLKMRRLTGIENVDTAVKLFEKEWPTPLFICPCGSQKAFHAEGEVATAKAARSQNHLQILSTMSTTSLADVTNARGEAPWFQLYPSRQWNNTIKMVKDAEEAGCTTLVLTVDMDAADKRETLLKRIKEDSRNCRSCHFPQKPIRNKPILNQFGNRFESPTMLSWDLVKKLKDSTKMNLVLKGIVSEEDAKIAMDHHVDGIIVSNHGGRASESGRASIDSLSDVVNVTQGQIPVMMDGGIRRGKDIFKALARGADAVGIGRPYLWGLGSFGQTGVEMVLKILLAEFELTMQQTGVKSISEISESNLMDQ